ncbi:MAG TPA: CbiX/SirB N-terminal domain-containing protein [Burkholderiales bacterium]|nr:CbiX/SirB N-terminal domain-containing protein [Burkholderiales bacterium]
MPSASARCACCRASTKDGATQYIDARSLTAGIVLFAHGSRDREWARPFEQLAASLSKSVDGPVKLAYLELMQPSLDEAIAGLVRDGVSAIRVIPVFLGAGGHVKDDLPQLAARARKEHPDVIIKLEPPIGEQTSVIEAIAAAIARGN